MISHFISDKISHPRGKRKSRKAKEQPSLPPGPASQNLQLCGVKGKDGSERGCPCGCKEIRVTMSRSTLQTAGATRGPGGRDSSAFHIQELKCICSTRGYQDSQELEPNELTRCFLINHSLMHFILLPLTKLLMAKKSIYSLETD